MTNRFVPLKQDDASALVTGCQIVTGVVELYCGDDVGCRNVSHVLVTSIARNITSPDNFGMETRFDKVSEERRWDMRLLTFRNVLDISFVAKASGGG